MTATAFASTNEAPPHQESFNCKDRPFARHQCAVARFHGDGGYATPSLWLSDGWATREAEGWEAPGFGASLMVPGFADACGRRPVAFDGAGHTCELFTKPTPLRAGPQGLCDRSEWEVAVRSNLIDD